MGVRLRAGLSSRKRTGLSETLFVNGSHASDRTSSGMSRLFKSDPSSGWGSIVVGRAAGDDSGGSSGGGEAGSQMLQNLHLCFLHLNK